MIKKGFYKRLATGVALPVICGAVLGCLLPQKITRANAAEGELYANGAFDNFFEQDYNLTLRNWNTFTSLASSDAIGDIAINDDPAFVSYDGLNEGNHAIKLSHGDRPVTEKSTLSNSFYTHLNRSLDSVSSAGGPLEVSFDLRVNDWEDADYVSPEKGVPLLYFYFEGHNDKVVIVSPDAEKLEANGALSNDIFSSVSYTKYSSYPVSGSLEGGYRHVSATFNITEAQIAGSAVTVLFRNNNKYTANIDNFQVKYNDTVILSEDFETFDLGIWACADPSETDPWKNWGVSQKSEDSSYSSAKFIKDDGNYALRFQRNQGVFTYSKRGSLVDYFLGGSRIFMGAGIYKVAADIKITGDGASSRLDFDLTDADNIQTPGIYTNLLSGGSAYYNALPDSTARAGYKRLEYLFELSAAESGLLDSICLTFDTAAGKDVLYLDNLSITAATPAAPQTVWKSTSALDLSARTDFSFASNIGSTAATLSAAYNGTSETVPAEYVTRKGNTFCVDFHYFDFVGYKGEYVFTVANSAGSATAAVTVSGETGLPAPVQRAYEWYKSGDLSVGVELKGARVLSIQNDGIALRANEYTLSKNSDAIILRENCLKGLINDENVFVVETTDGSFSFTVIITEAPPPEPNGLPGWAIGLIVAGSVVVCAGLAFGGIMLCKKNKKNSEEKKNEQEND